MPAKNKPLIAFLDLTGCEGCMLSFILSEEAMPLLDSVEIKEFRLIQQSEQDKRQADITFIEGAAASKRDIELLKRARDTSKILVAVGACACTGGLHAYRNFMDMSKFAQLFGPSMEAGYVQPGPADKHVKIDHSIEGCPPDRREIARFLKNHLLGKTQRQCKNPVCLECRLHENKCLLDDNRLCLGPVTAGGCDAVCINGNFECWGCRGPSDDPNHAAISELLEKSGFKKDELRQRTRTFAGMKTETPPEQNIKEVLAKLKKEAHIALAKEAKKKAKEEKDRKKKLMLEKKKIMLAKKKEAMQKKRELAMLKKQRQKQKAELRKKMMLEKKRLAAAKAKKKAIAKAKDAAKKKALAKAKAEKLKRLKALKKQKQQKTKMLKAKKLAEKKAKAAKKKAEAKKAAQKRAAEKKKAAAKKAAGKKKPAKKPAKKQKAKPKKAPKKNTAKKSAPKTKAKMSLFGRIASLGKKKKKR